MARIKVKPLRSFPQKPALAGNAPKDLESVKKKIAEMVIMHHAIKGKKMKSAALASKDGQMSV